MRAPRRPVLLVLAALTFALLPVAAQAEDQPPAGGAYGDDHAKPINGSVGNGGEGVTEDGGDSDDQGDDEHGSRSGAVPAGTGAPAPDAPDFGSVTAIDPRLADLAAAAYSQNPAGKIHVLVFRSDASGTAIDGATVAARDLASLASASGVAYVMVDVPVLPTARADATPALEAMPFASLVGAPAAWRRGLSGKGVGIAVVDSGVTRTADFPGSRLVQARLAGQEVAVDDAYGHGTFVGAIAGGSNPVHRGVAPGSPIYAVNVAHGDGVYTSDVIAGLQWVLANHTRLKIRVVTLSLSETAPSSYRANPLDTVVEQLWRAGVVVVASAGNLGPGTALFAPANDPFAITVGALDTDRRAASFSSSGTTPDGFAKPDLLAPGRHIVSALPTGSVLAGLAPAANVVAPGYAMMSGTSMSAPQVAAAAAIVLQQHPRWTPDQVKWLLTRTAMPVADAPGSLDLARAVAFAGKPPRAAVAARSATFGLDRSTGALRRLREQEMPDGSPTFDAGTWTAGTWTAGTWTAGTWTAGTWTAGTWTAGTWTAAGWN